MLVLGLDPGATTGWCLYDTEAKRVVKCGAFEQWYCAEMADALCGVRFEHVVIESIVPARGGIYPQTVEAALIQGHLEEFVENSMLFKPQRITRGDIRKALSAAVHHDPLVVNDKTAWQALVALHGDDSGRKTTKKCGPGGAIGDVSSHERAALAAVVAWAMHAGVWKK